MLRVAQGSSGSYAGSAVPGLGCPRPLERPVGLLILAGAGGLADGGPRWRACSSREWRCHGPEARSMSTGRGTAP